MTKNELEEIYKLKLKNIHEKLENDPDYDGYLDDMTEVSVTLKELIAQERHLNEMEISKEKRKAMNDISKKDVISWLLAALGAAVPIGLEIGKIAAENKRSKRELDFRRETRDMVFKYECEDDQIFTSTVGKTMSSNVYPKK